VPILEIDKLCRSFGGLRAVDEVSFGVQRGQIKSVIGPNGAGKTTLFNLVCGALRPDAGTARFEGTPIQGQPPFRIASLGISRTFQNIKLFHGMSVLDSVMVGRHPRSRSGMLPSMLRLPRARHEERDIRSHAAEMLTLLDIGHLAEHEATRLSFGQQRAVEFARALATEPRLLLLDEPAAGLNIQETASVARLITKIRDTGVTILLVEHDMSLVMSISDEIVVLSSGRKIAEGKPREIQANKEVISVYLGEDDNA
jgi:branched-chain amino acid transport system ATP-binding protein